MEISRTRPAEQLLPIRAVFWDLDGTLIDSMPAHVRAWRVVLQEIGIAIDELYLQLHEGEKAEDTISRLAQDHHLNFSPVELHELIERKRTHYRSLAPSGLIPEARRVVEQLNRRGIECDIVTGSVRANLNGVVSPEELALFRHVITADNYTQGKPAPDPYLTALKQSGFSRSECLAVENAPLGIQSAKAAGLRTIAITRTLAPEHLREADQIIHSYSELLTIFT